MRMILTALLAVALVIAFSAAVLLWMLDDAGYRRLSIWLVHASTGAELQLSEDFELAPGRHLILKGSRMQLTSVDERLRITILDADAQIDLWALSRGTILVESLRASGGQINWSGSDEETDESYVPGILPLAQRLHIRNFSIVLDPVGGSGPITVVLQTLDVDAPDASQPLTLTASGRVNDHRLSVTGELGRLAQFWSPPAAGFPIHVSVEGPNAVLQVSGTVADPIGLTGAQLTVHAHAPSIAKITAPFATLPEFGGVQIDAALQGDLRSPRVTRVHLESTRPGLTLRAEGRAENLFSTDGLELNLFANIDPAVAFAGTGSDFITQLSVRGQLSGGVSTLRLSNIDGFAISPTGVHVTFTGAGQAALEEAALGEVSPGETSNRSTLSLMARIISPADARSLGFLPRTLLDLEEVLVNVSFAHAERTLKVDLQTSENRKPTIKAAATAVFGPTSLTELTTVFEGSGRTPGGGPFDLRGRIDKAGAGFTLSNLILEHADSDLMFRASGGLGAFNSQEWLLGPIDIQIEGSATDAGALLTWTQLDRISGLGPMQFAMNLVGTTSLLTIPTVSFTAGTTEGLNIRVSGRVNRIEPGLTTTFPLAGVHTELSVSAPSTAALGIILGRPIPDLGALELNGTMSDQDGVLGVESLQLDVSRAGASVLRLAGAIDDILNLSDIRWTGSTDVDLAALLAEWVEPGTQLGTMRGEFVLSDEDGSLGIESFTLRSRHDTALSSELSGSFDDFDTFADLEASVRIDLVDTTILNRILGADHRVSGPIRVHGKISGNLNSVFYDGRLDVGRSHIETRAELRFEADKPRLIAKIVVPELYPAGLGVRLVGPAEAPATRDSSKTPVQLFSPEPLDFSWLDRQNFDIDLRVDTVAGQDYAIRDLALRATLDDGVFSLDPFKATYAGGATLARASLTNGQPPQVSLSLTSDDVVFGTLLALMTGSRSVSGELSARVDLTTQGVSSRELASNLSGHVGLVLENGAIPRQQLDLLAADLFGWTLGRVTRSKKAKFECVIGRFTVDAGVITTNAFFLEGPQLAMTGAGTIDLGAETIDVKILPKKKRRFRGSITPIHLTGALGRPTVTAIPARALAQEIGTLAFLPQFYLPVRALGYMFGMVADEDDSPCLAEADREALTPPSQSD
jgi:hypothetical protein